MLSGWEDGALRMHELTNSTQLWQIDNTHKFGITSLDFSPDSKFICTGGGDGVVRVWELRSRSMASNLKEHAHKITKVKLINGGGNLITSSRDKSLLLWDLVSLFNCLLYRAKKKELQHSAFQWVESTLLISMKDPV